MSKLLFLDIENAPSLGYVWQKWETDVLDFEQEWYLLSYAWKWQGDKKVKVKGLPDYKNFKKDKRDDSALVKDLWELMNEADVIIAHNGDRFDIRKSNARFLVNGLTPPEPYKTVDTLKIAKKNFNLNSNKLDDLGRILGVGRKLKHQGFDLWLECMAGDKKAWKTMLDYNKKDVELLERVYNKLLPWCHNHPNRALLDNKDFACPNCGSDHLQRRGYNITRVSKFQRFQCVSCGAWSQSRFSEKPNTLEIK